MHDIEFIRDNPELFDRAMAARGLDNQAEKIISLSSRKKKDLSALYSLKEQRNSITKEIAEIRRRGDDASQQVELSKKVTLDISSLERKLREDNELQKLMDMLPNIPDASVPIGLSEADNIEVRTWGQKKNFPFQPVPHYETGEALKLMDFRRAASLSGSRFSILVGQLAQLERALANFMLRMHSEEFGYTEIFHQALVNDSAMYNVGQLPKFHEDSFVTTNDLRLIPTSEVVLTNLVAGANIPLQCLPLRFTAYSQCFRAEAGSAGLDTRGMIRQHQFSKVELVSITSETESDKELIRMLSVAEEVLKRLDLPYRIMLLCSGDMGFSASMSYDIEVWMPAQSKYREISSCSNCKAFQARRMRAKYFFSEGQTKHSRFVHTLNGSALAIGRTIAAIMENYQNADGSVTVPDVLRKYMDTNTITASKASFVF